VKLTSASSPELEGEVLDDLLDLRVDGGILLVVSVSNWPWPKSMCFQFFRYFEFEVRVVDGVDVSAYLTPSDYLSPPKGVNDRIIPHVDPNRRDRVKSRAFACDIPTFLKNH
jgi:hypothetical protein